MKIVLTGVETNNKGAELMLYAILQEIEKKFPEAIVYIPVDSVKQGIDYVQTKLKLRNKPFATLIQLCRKFYITGVLYRLKLPCLFLTDIHSVKGTDYLIDASGFVFSDLWNPSDAVCYKWEHQLEGYRKQKTKIIFLPQAFGPLERPNTKRLINSIAKNSDVIFARDDISYNYLSKYGISVNKLKLFPDFTASVDGMFPPKYNHLKGAVCIIPNCRMIDKGNTVSYDDYLTFLSKTIELCIRKGKSVYLLNHEGLSDEKFALKCAEQLDHKIEVITGLNALEVKGLISTAYLCITSRFHGAASALNTTVPCLATSWSHKYIELFKIYGLENNILPLNDFECASLMIEAYLDKDKNNQVREKLAVAVKKIKKQNADMWNMVWKI